MGKNAGILTILAIVIGCGVAGCSAAPPEAAPTPPSTSAAAPTPTASEPIAAATAPTPRLSASCDSLVSPETADAAFAGHVSLQPTGYYPHSDGPVGISVQQIGALNCIWANGVKEPDWTSGGSSDFRGATLSIVPDGEAPWGVYKKTYSGPESVPSPYGENALGPNCVPDLGECFFQGLVGTNWVDLTVTGVGGVGRSGSGAVAEEQKLDEAEMHELVTPMIDSIVQALEAEPAAPSRWVVPATTAALPGECESFLQPAQAEEFSGVTPLSVGVNWDGPKVGQFNFGRTETGAERCHINLANSDSGIGYFDYLPGGSWAFDRFSAIWLADGSAVETPLAGLEADDAAITRCAVLDDTCSVDLRIGGNWVQLNITAYAPDFISAGGDVRMARDNVGEIAGAIVANIKRVAA